MIALQIVDFNWAHSSYVEFIETVEKDRFLHCHRGQQLTGQSHHCQIANRHLQVTSCSETIQDCTCKPKLYNVNGEPYPTSAFVIGARFLSFQHLWV